MLRYQVAIVRLHPRPKLSDVYLAWIIKWKRRQCLLQATGRHFTAKQIICGKCRKRGKNETPSLSPTISKRQKKAQCREQVQLE